MGSEDHARVAASVGAEGGIMIHDVEIHDKERSASR